MVNSEKESRRRAFFSNSRNEALIELQKLQYTTLSIKFCHCTMSELKTHVFTLSSVLACLSKHCADQKQHSNPNFLTKSDKDRLQTCVKWQKSARRRKIKAQA